LFFREPRFICCVAGPPDHVSESELVTMPNFTEEFAWWAVWVTNPGGRYSRPKFFFVLPP
jgi:hypothetical protein